MESYNYEDGVGDSCIINRLQTVKWIVQGQVCFQAIPLGVSSKTARLQRLQVRIRTCVWTSVECCVLGIGLCDGLITRPEEDYGV